MMSGLPLIVRVKGVTFWGQQSPTGEGFYIDKDGFTGWDDGSDMRRDAVERPQAVGAFDVPGYLSSRVISISGSAYTAEPRNMAFMRSSLTGLLAQGDSAAITVEHSGETLTMSGRLASKTQFKVLGVDQREAEYQIQFWCADPRKYGESRTVTPGTSITALHYGNFPALPVLTVDGAMGSGYTVNGPAGKLYTVTTPLVSGHPHTIDMRDGYLRVDGAVVVGGVTQADLWTIPPGTTVDMSLTGTGSGTLASTTPDTFV